LTLKNPYGLVTLVRILKNFYVFEKPETRDLTKVLSIPALTVAVQLGIYTLFPYKQC